MKRYLCCLGIFLALTGGAQKIMISEADKARARDLVEKMTTDEKISYLSGETSFSLRPIERLGIPRILLADGPQGIRNHCKHSTLYPCGILAASTWNRDLIHRYGEGLGNDARARGVGILLGPGVNIYRSPLCGRNFEYMGEDPYLTSEIACSYIRGVQSKGVIATVKHFAANNQEWSRHHVSSDVDERTLQEIYFPAFRKAVREAGVGAVMNSYNLVNGVHTTENPWLNTTVLRDDWGFDGVLMSDWTSVYSTVNAANSGLDLEMPKGVFFTDSLIRDALENGRIEMRTLDAKVAHMLQTFSAFGLLDREQKDELIPLDNPASNATALETAREGIILLKNDDNILPLKGKTLILGTNSDTIVSGGGSGAVYAYHISPLSRSMKRIDERTVALGNNDIFDDVTSDFYTGPSREVKGFRGSYFKNMEFEGDPSMERVDEKIKFEFGYKGPSTDFPDDRFSIRWNAFFRPDENETLRITVGGDDGYRLSINDSVVAQHWGNHSYSCRIVNYPVVKDRDYEFRLEYFDSSGEGKVNFSAQKLNGKLLASLLRKADNVVINTGFDADTEGEGADRSFRLPEYEENFIREIAQLNPNVVVVLNSGGAVDLMPWTDYVKGIILAWYPGQEGGTALSEILTGKVSPSGKLPITYYKTLEESPAYDNYYANRTKVRSSDRNETKHVEYREGIFHGYRGSDLSGVKPLYPFGYGMSYSTFEFSDLTLRNLGNHQVEVEFLIKNTGKKEAKEVAQIYVSDLESSVKRPLKELKGFEKVTLKPGEGRKVTVILDEEAFSFYDIHNHEFVVEPGEFKIQVGSSSEDIHLEGKIVL